MKQTFTFIIFTLLCCFSSFPQKTTGIAYWHDKERSLRYQPDGDDFVITNGTRRFNRALYGTHTAFRVETGDLPEFAMYLPGMGGNMKFGLGSAKGSKWLNDAENIVARYRPGCRLYEIHDPLLGQGTCLLTVLAMSDDEGIIVRVEFKNVSEKITLFTTFGGVSGKKFSRDGDLNVDPESNFYLKAENCKTNKLAIQNNGFTLYYGDGKVISDAESDGSSGEQEKSTVKKYLMGVVPPGSLLKVADAAQQENPVKLFDSPESSVPVLSSKLEPLSNKSYFFLVQKPGIRSTLSYDDANKIFDKAEEARNILASKIKVETPDPFINTLGGTLAIAADAIWEEPTYMHGAIGWRMRLNGWRGPYAGDPLGWHDRSRTHFNAYAKSQVTTPESGPSIPDPAKNLARQEEKMGNALYTSGYICRNPDGKLSPHHYDMNLVFIDALIRHFNWTGDLTYIKEMWPVLKRHLAWEKRNFDADNDGLYDAYCCIWASDALEYNGSGVTHSSAYNYLANKSAAYLASLVGDNPEPFSIEADKILKAMNERLWIPSKGWFAEYQDLLGLKRQHPSAALWTIYHTIDSEVPDVFQAYQMTRYVDNNIPHIPVLAKGLPDNNYYVLSTTHWMPYDWSLNNVVMAENLHTALAYWQAGRGDDAFTLWKSTLLDAMYLGSSPGNFAQMSFYDAARGEAYRDFADEIGMTSRSLVEGLYGIKPNALNKLLIIRPGLPISWDYASLKTPDLSFDYKHKGKTDTYTIQQSWPIHLNLKFIVRARTVSVKSVTLNGKKLTWENEPDAIEHPSIIVEAPAARSSSLVIEWQGETPDSLTLSSVFAKGDSLEASFNKANITSIFDPQHVLNNATLNGQHMKAVVTGENGNHTIFIKLNQGQFSWWKPIGIEVKNHFEIVAPIEQNKNGLTFSVKNNTSLSAKGKLIVNEGSHAFLADVTVKPENSSDNVFVPANHLRCGSNTIRIEWENGSVTNDQLLNWEIPSNPGVKYETIPLTTYFNDQVTHIFTNRYLTPRSPYPTLAIPAQGIGNWCYPMVTANIDDSGLRNLAGTANRITLPQGIPFVTPGAAGEKNIVFTSLWDNYPAEVSIPLAGKAFGAYLLMAGSTNPMQSQFTNGEIIVEYTDGTQTSLELRNPETWWPIEQDYMTDDYAFSLTKAKPIRVHLKTGLITRAFNNYSTIKGFSTSAIDGGAATVLDIPLDPSKRLKNLKLKTSATEVVIGLMSVTLVQGT
jgi:hypothetical protein